MTTRAKNWILRPYLVSARWIEEESTILVTDTFCVLTSVIRKFCLLKNILAYCWYLPTSPFFLLLSEHKHCDNAQQIRTARKLEAEWWQVCREACVRGQRKMSQALGAFGLLDFTMLLPVLACRAFWNLWTVYFSNFPIFFRAALNRG